MTTSRHTAAIHVLKGRLQLTDEDYRALLLSLTGKGSTRDMSDAQRLQVREHLHKLAQRMGLEQPAPRAGGKSFAQRYGEASARERKVWALWGALKRAGLLQHADARALDAFVQRQCGVAALRFCNAAQLDALIESLKLWARRGSEGTR